MFKYIKKLINYFKMDKKRKKYLVTDADTYACSLVDDPAIEIPFLAFSSEETSLHFSSDEKHNVTGPVAIPNLPIYRLTPNGEEYDIVFSEEAIEKMSQNFLKNFRQMNVNLMHDDDLAQGGSAYLVEQWLINDPDNDKANAMGFKKLPKGTWMQTYHIDSIDTWERIRSGELRGFSIECAVSMEEFDRQIEKQSKEETKEENNTIEPVHYEDMEAQEQPTVVEQTQETVVETPTVEEQAPVVEQTQEEEVVETEQQETVVEQPTQEEVVEQPQQETQEQPANPQDELIKNLLEEVKTLKNQISELSSKPSTKPLNVQSGNGGTSGNDSYMQWRRTMSKYI